MDTKGQGRKVEENVDTITILFLPESNEGGKRDEEDEDDKERRRRGKNQSNRSQKCSLF